MNIQKMLIIAVIAIFSVNASIYAANNTNKTVKSSPIQTVSTENIYTEDKSNITVTPNQPIFVIKLKSNPTTGYSWFLREYNGNILMPMNHQFEKSSDELMGASGHELWTFKVKPAGFVVPQQTIIRLVYARPWQGSENSTQVVFRVTTLKSQAK